MEMEDDQQPVPMDPDELVKVATYCFNLFTEANEIPAARWPEVTPIQFLEWLGSQGGALYPSTLAGELGVSEAVVEFFLGLPERSYGPNQLMGIWPYMTLGSRPCHHPVHTLGLVLLVRWEDGTVMPMHTLVHADVANSPIKDAEAVSTITIHTPNLLRLISNNGLDVLHDRNQTTRGMADEKILKLLLMSAEKTPINCTQDERARMIKLVHWLFSLFPGKLSPEMRAKLTGKPASAARPSGSPRGGFNAG